jgi:transposase
MSSETHSSQNRYKSRLFNFFNRQAIQFSDRLGVAFRNLKVATEWGLQIVIYPIYLAVQAGRSAGKQLGHRIEKSFLLSSSEDSESKRENTLELLDCDRPIDKILKTIEPTLEIATEHFPLIPTTPPTSIRGIASLLENQQLVLVDRDNQILDILNSQQQQKLKQSITLEVANYYRDRRLLRDSQQKFPGYLPSINSDNNKVLPPLRLFWQTMDWVQHSPVAVAIDLFGESTLVPRDSSFKFENVSLTDRQQLQLTQVLANIDDKIADLEVKQLSPVVQSLERFGDNWQEIRHKLQSNPQIDRNESDSELVKSERVRKPQLVTRLSDSLQQVSQKIQHNTSNSTTKGENSSSNPFQLQALIQAAIDYFFGKQGNNYQVEGNKVSKKVLGDRQKQTSLKGRTNDRSLPVASDSEEEDLWLSWEDLYESSISEESIQTSLPGDSRRRLQLSGNSSVPISPQKSSSNSLGRSLQRQQQKALQVIKKSQSGNLIKSSEEQSEIIRSASDSNSISEYQSSASEIDNNVETDWWEVKSTSAGYERHPLEIVIKLLDRVILWLEELFLFIWRRIKRLFRG